MKPVIGITLGDATGIGPELIAKLCAEDRLKPYCRPVIIGDVRILEMGKKIAKVDFPVQLIDDISLIDWEGAVPVLDLNNLDPASITLGEIDPISGRVTAEACITAIKLWKKGLIEGFVYAPLHKAAFILGGYDFECENFLFSHYIGTGDAFGEMNVFNNLWTSRVTSHIPIKDVASILSKEKVYGAIRLAHETLSKAGYDYPRIAVAALNPHGGESGLCGREEIDVIMPGIEMAKEKGINTMGPYPADTIFINAFNGEYDAVVTMYHDEGQIAMKLMGFHFGVTVGAGHPFPIATPAHGTAFDIVGQGVAKVGAIEQAVIIASKMASWKNNSLSQASKLETIQ